MNALLAVDMAKMKIRGAGRAGSKKTTGCRCATGWSAISRIMRRLASRAFRPPMGQSAQQKPRCLRKPCSKIPPASARRARFCPNVRRRCIRRPPRRKHSGPGPMGRERVVLFADTYFNRAYERENLDGRHCGGAGSRVAIAWRSAEACRCKKRPAVLRDRHLPLRGAGGTMPAAELDRLVAALCGPFAARWRTESFGLEAEAAC